MEMARNRRSKAYFGPRKPSEQGEKADEVASSA